ncbi:MAG: hypothetical protein F6K48_03180 [Okeania sp. SIO3H1]|nr:hypothetical protein [Okeania sp. SIO3H1]
MAFLGLIPEVDRTVDLRMTPEQVKREATGRALALIGSTVGMVGGIMILSTNPAFKQEAQGVWKNLPPQVHQNKAGVIIALGLGASALIAYNMMRGNQRRYG